MSTTTKVMGNRRTLLIKLRARGLTQEEIGSELGVTRQRVQQMEHKFFGPRRDPDKHKEYILECSQCGNTKRLPVSGRKFCSRRCFFLSRRIVRTKVETERILERRKARNRQRSKLYYHSVFKRKAGWKAIVRERNRRYAQKHLTS